jgi:polyhydroxyalkanoate synthesis regulator phasin
MRNKIIAALVAGGLLVGAGFVTSLVSAPSTASAQEDAAGSDAEGKGPFHRGFEFLSGVLDELVGEGTISQEDATVVLDAVEEKAAEVKAEHEAMRELIKGFIEDGILTRAEFDQLPTDNPFAHERFDVAWEDGELTQEEIREARPHPRREFFKRGARFGALLDDGGIDRGEYDALGADHPLKQIEVEKYFDGDDLITPDELREIWQAHRADFQTDNQGA